MTRRRRRQPPRVSRFLRGPCPDCAARFIDAELQHEDSCPLSAAVEAVCDEDRAYFATHPQEWTRTRAITRAERQTLQHVDPVGSRAEPDHVHVLNRPPWGRVRQFCTGHEFTTLGLDPEENAS